MARSKWTVLSHMLVLNGGRICRLTTRRVLTAATGNGIPMALAQSTIASKIKMRSVSVPTGWLAAIGLHAYRFRTEVIELQLILITPKFKLFKPNFKELNVPMSSLWFSRKPPLDNPFPTCQEGSTWRGTPNFHLSVESATWSTHLSSSLSLSVCTNPPKR